MDDTTTDSTLQPSKGKGGRKAAAAGGRTFGQLVRKPSGRWQASYPDPEGRTKIRTKKDGTEVVEKVRYYGPTTYDTKMDGEQWLIAERRLISDGTWTPPAARAAAKELEAKSAGLTFGTYSTTWLKTRKVKGRPLAATTRSGYLRDLRDHILPTFEDVPLKAITDIMIDEWYEMCAPGHPTTRANAYGLLRAILTTASDRRLIPYNPAKVRGGGTKQRAHKIKPLEINPETKEGYDKVGIMLAIMPARRRLMVQLALWCALRSGELQEVRRSDIDLRRKVIKIRRGRTLVDDHDLADFILPPDSRWCDCRKGCVVGPPKTEAGARDVPIPEFLLPDIRAHLLEHTGPGADGLLFPGADGIRHMGKTTFIGRATTYYTSGPKKGEVRRKGHGWYAARQAIGRDDLRLHDLRHTGLTNAAHLGATTAELMAFAGHATPAAAMIYQHATSDRMKQLGEKMSKLATSEG